MKYILYNLSISCLLLLSPFLTHAQGIVTCDICNLSDLTALLQKLLEWVFMFATFIVVIMFMYAGFLLISAGGDTSKIQKAKTIFKRVIIGFIIMFIAVLSVRQLLITIGVNPFFQSIIQ